MSALISSILGPMLIKLAVDAGVPMVRQILERKIGAQNTDLIEGVVRSIAEKAGVEPDTLSDLAQESPELVQDAMRSVEEISPQLIALYDQGLAGQFALLQAENKDGGLASAWRWGWMYLLAFFWLWTVILVPMVNTIFTANIERIDLAILLTLTGWFISLYMGGHTLKELGKNVSDAVKSWKDQS